MTRSAPIRTLALLVAPAMLLSGCIPAGRPERPAPAPSPAPPAPARPTMEPAEAPPPFETNRATANAVESVATLYTVVPGDTLRSISDKTNAGSEAIARENGLVPPFLIRAGQRLRIPAGRWHLVRAGETGISIARAYGVEWQRVAALNDLTEPYILRTGQRLMVPSEREVATMTVEQRAQAFHLDIGDIITGGEPAIAEAARPVTPVETQPRATPLPSSVAVAPPVTSTASFSGKFDWPLQGSIVRRFGNFGSGRRNDGINIGVAQGTPIHASADGVVTYAGTDLAAYGGLILIRHGNSWTTAYGHASELLVSRGQAVRKGQIIARAGDTGSADSPQLHFEIRQGARPVDPIQHLPRRG